MIDDEDEDVEKKKEEGSCSKNWRQQPFGLLGTLSRALKTQLHTPFVLLFLQGIFTAVSARTMLYADEQRPDCHLLRNPAEA